MGLPKMEPGVKEFLYWFTVFCLTCTSIGTFFSGMSEAFEKDHCVYENVIEFFPSRVVGCELGRKWWKK